MVKKIKTKKDINQINIKSHVNNKKYIYLLLTWIILIIFMLFIPAELTIKNINISHLLTIIVVLYYMVISMCFCIQNYSFFKRLNLVKDKRFSSFSINNAKWCKRISIILSIIYGVELISTILVVVVELIPLVMTYGLPPTSIYLVCSIALIIQIISLVLSILLLIHSNKYFNSFIQTKGR